ncbi:MAG: hypothetical protein ISP86_06000 [Shewanellaceae bacterium]|nr:hypothetical protein [Shewanellaceae bacterium]
MFEPLNKVRHPTNRENKGAGDRVSTPMVWVLVLLIGVNAGLGLALYHTQQALTHIKVREAHTFDENTNLLRELYQCESNNTLPHA